MGAVGFSISNKGYIGTGSGDTLKKDLWEYDPGADTWTQKADFGGNARWSAVGFSIEGKGYIGTGISNTGLEKDFWEYDPSNNTWIQKADFTGGARSGAVGFSIGTRGYIGTGSPLTNDFWEYYPGANTWTQKAEFPGSARYDATGFSIGNKGYIGTGYDYGWSCFSDFWEYDSESNTWMQKAYFSGGKCSGATGFSIADKGYIGLGWNVELDSYEEDFCAYDPVSNTWTSVAYFVGEGRRNAAGFSIGNKGYVGTGYVDNYEDFWEYTPQCNGLNVFADADNDGFGDSSASVFISDCILPGGYVYNHTDCNDNNASVHPGSCDEINGNGIDDNCDGTADNGWGTVVFYIDADSDEYGDPNSFIYECSQPAGYVTDSSDCNDADDAINPNALEILNGIDDNCNGVIDDPWYQVADFGGAGRWGATGFSIGTKGYISTGSNASGYQNDFWEYDPTSDSWTQKATYGGGDTYLGVGFSIDNKGYIGTGLNASGKKNDFWEYDPANNTWIQKANFGGTGRNAATGFSIGSKGYIGLGSDGSLKSDFWEYDPSTDQWLQKANFGGGARYFATGFSISSKGYIGTGTDGGADKKDFWQYDPNGNTWTQKADFGGTERWGAIAFCIDSKGFIGIGTDDNYKNDFWEYDPTNDAWAQKAPFAGPVRQMAVGFSIGSKGYIGTGSYYKDFWEYAPVCVGPTFYADADADSYGNFNDSIYSTDCLPPVGYVDDTTDCDDTNSNVHPGTVEILNNGIDDNCDGYVDEFGTSLISSGNTPSVFSLFPNPTNGHFVVLLQLSPDLNNEVKIEVINLFGHVLFAKTTALLKGKLQQEIKPGDLEEGIYLVRVLVNDQVYLRPIFYQK
jgi:hypothetical protein